MSKIECRNVTKVFEAGGDRFEAVSDLSFLIQSGELVSVVWRTGCCKSSTLHMTLGLERPTSGRITIDDKEPYGDFAYFRGRLAAVFQTDPLLPSRPAMAGKSRLGRLRERLPASAFGRHAAAGRHCSRVLRRARSGFVRRSVRPSRSGDRDAIARRLSRAGAGNPQNLRIHHS